MQALELLARALEANPMSAVLWIVYLLIYYSSQKSIGKDDMFKCAVCSISTWNSTVKTEYLSWLKMFIPFGSLCAEKHFYIIRDRNMLDNWLWWCAIYFVNCI